MEKTQDHATIQPIESSLVAITYFGYALLTVSFLVYIMFDLMNLEGKGSSAFMLFVFHYLFALAYVIILTINKAYGIRRSWRKEHIHNTIILLNLFLISAYALNREITVFEDSTNWLCGYLILTSLTTLSYRYFSRLPKWVNILQCLLLGSALVLYLYLSLFVAEVYVFGSIGALLFGIGLHAFVPLTLFVGSITLILHTYPNHRATHYWIIPGICIPILCTVSFMYTWKSRISIIERIANQSVISDDAELPVWIKVGQSIENDWLTRLALKSDLVYTESRSAFEWDWNPANNSWDEKRKHDPLIFLSSLVVKCPLSTEDRIKILQSLYDVRHQASERLWKGDDLSTSYIVSDIDIYPDLRLAYTEKYLNIRNHNKNRWRSEEAIYTFQLPEGSVVTSLSLWINGKEEKAILTSKQKATRAYNTIVGARRDPSVIHWQEGNTVSVRVFPCTPEEERKFKMGITSILSEKNGNIVYKNIIFRGPNSNDAKETTRVRFVGSAENILLPNSFKLDKKDDYLSEQSYNPNFQFSFKAVPLKLNRFTFDGFTYSIVPYKPVSQSIDINKIYLDINKNWNRHDLESMEALLNYHALYGYADGEFIQLTKENWLSQTDELASKNFSLFPFHQISDSQHALVVTKGNEFSPHLSDFKESKFAQGISKFFSSGKKIKVYNLEDIPSTYIASLRELRAFEFSEGNVDQLTNWLANKIFPLTEESDEKVILHDANLMILKNKKDDTAPPDNAPDHLVRLFAYNDIMRKVGANYFTEDYVNEDLVNEATTAYVVSPVSSLIVLETQQDYDNFDIEDNKNSLHNAIKSSSGSVPEPHEWALIILFLLFVIYMIRYSKFRTTL